MSSAGSRPLRPRRGDIGRKWACTPIGSHRYDWSDRNLVDSAGKAVSIDDAERALIERFVKQDTTVHQDPAFSELAKRLDLPTQN